MRLYLLPFWLLLAISKLGCVTAGKAHFGIQENQLAKVPARIAVLNCQPWPAAARYQGLEATELASSEVQALCQQVDAFVLKGFEGQPYMRGLSPRVVKALAESVPINLDQLTAEWPNPDKICKACQHPASYYREVLAPLAEWRQQLSLLGRTCKNSDAVLIPMVLSLNSRSIDDRGLFYAQRKASLAFLLIDTNDGSLIWIGGREAETRRPLQQFSKATPPEAFAPWEELWTQLFVSDLWREFPGRQN